MISARMLGCQQQEDQVDRFVMRRIEIDRLLEASKEAHNALQRSDLDMRNGKTPAQPRRSEPLALPHQVKDGAGVESRDQRGVGAELGQSLLLALGLQ